MDKSCRLGSMDTTRPEKDQNTQEIGENEIRNVDDHIYHEKIEHLLKDAEKYRLEKMGEVFAGYGQHLAGTALYAGRRCSAYSAKRLGS